MPLSNHYKRQKMSGEIDFTSDTFRIILMNDSFTFDQDADAIYDAGIIASELTTANGYTQGTMPLGTVNIDNIEDDTNNRSEVSFPSVEWTASGGSIGPSNGAIIYDLTTSDNTIVGYIPFAGAQTATDGGTFAIHNITIRET